MRLFQKLRQTKAIDVATLEWSCPRIGGGDAFALHLTALCLVLCGVRLPGPRLSNTGAYGYNATPSGSEEQLTQ